MSLASFNFLYFLLAALAIYYLLPRRPQNHWLLLLSYAFCITWAWEFALVLLAVTTINFILARRLQAATQHRRAWLWLAISFNVLTLALFRLGNFYVPELAALLSRFGLSTELGVLQILLPVGLSFYVVENISYQLDVYRRQIKATGDFLAYALYQAYFPKLLAGPIERAGTFLPQLAQSRLVDNERLARSLGLLAAGIFRKIIIADTLTAAIPPDVFTTPADFWAGELWAWLIIYGFALYNDFAGYTSLARGVSGLFGIELSPNFRQPYFARNFGEFWNSWHITLSHWLRDYIYFPLQRGLLRRHRNRRALTNIVIPPLATMLVSGLWHGFSAHMLLWGALHGLYLTGERILSLSGPVVPPDRRPPWRQLLAMGLIFTLVMLAWVPFRLELPAALAFWQQLLAFGDVGLRYRRLAVIGAYVLAALALDVVQRYSGDEVIYLRWPRPAQALLLAIVIFLAIILSASETAEPFVYQGF